MEAILRVEGKAIALTARITALIAMANAPGGRNGCTCAPYRNDGPVLAVHRVQLTAADVEAAHIGSLEARRLIGEIERKRGSRVILLVHRQETMSFLGIPIVRYIDLNDSEEVIRAIRLTDANVPIDLVLHTPGGLVLAATQIARAINRRKGKVTVIVPHYAMSGGTLIALAADEIVISDHAVLGPVDPQLGQYPAVSLLKTVEEKSKDRLDDETLIMSDQAKKAIAQVEATVRELLGGKYPQSVSDTLAVMLSEGKWTHDFPITFDFAKGLGLHVDSAVPAEVLKLMTLYPQPVRHNPTVEYLPGRRVAEGRIELGESEGIA